MDVQESFQESQPFLHAEQSQPFLMETLVDRGESLAVVGDGETDTFR
jgi:hypothetical protein